MTLHLAASFSRDSLLLGLAFAFTALCMQAIFGCKDGTVLPVRLWLRWRCSASCWHRPNWFTCRWQHCSC